MHSKKWGKSMVGSRMVPAQRDRSCWLKKPRMVPTHYSKVDLRSLVLAVPDASHRLRALTVLSGLPITHGFFAYLTI